MRTRLERLSAIDWLNVIFVAGFSAFVAIVLLALVVAPPLP